MDDIKERVDRLEDAVNDILEMLIHKSDPDLAGIKAWWKAYRERKRKEQMDKALEEMRREKYEDPWLAVDSMTDEQLEECLMQKCEYDECKNTRTLKLLDIRNMSWEEREEEMMYWCSKSCFARWRAFEDLYQDWPLKETGKISDEDWKRRVKKARSAHLESIRVN